MSRILFAAPVTSNLIRSDAHHRCPEERSLVLLGAVRLRAVRTVTFEVEQIKMVSCAELFCSELSGQSYIAVCAL